MPDCHVGGGGGITCAEGDFKNLPSFAQSFINCETNAGTSDHGRAMDEASDLQAWFNYGAQAGQQPQRLIARTASFCTERSGHYDAFDQGISFFLPNGTWLQPPGYVHSMVTAAWQPNAAWVTIESGGANPNGGAVYSASAQVSDDGSALTIQIVNNNNGAGSVTLNLLGGFTPVGAIVVTTLNSTSTRAANTPAQPAAISPVTTTTSWTPGGFSLTVPAYSFTILQASSVERR